VLALRREYQEAMRDETSDKIAELTGRTVIAMMSANHLDPDRAAEIYVLDEKSGRGPAQSAPPVTGGPAAGAGCSSCPELRSSPFRGHLSSVRAQRGRQVHDFWGRCTATRRYVSTLRWRLRTSSSA
jgi:hypothetical protein